MADVGKILKVHQIAKELKIASQDILKYLESRGADVTRGMMQPVTEEMYVELLRRFDPARFQKLVTEQTAARQTDKKADIIKQREAELRTILEAKPAEKAAPVKPAPGKIELPSGGIKVIQPAPAEPAPPKAEASVVAPPVEKAAPSVNVVPEAQPSASPEPEPAAKPVKKGAKGAAKAPVPVAETTAPAPTPPEVAPAAPVSAPKKTAEPKRKPELPKPIPLVRVEPATPKGKKLKRKPVLPKDETPIEAIETEVVSKYERVSGKLKAVPRKVEEPPTSKKKKKGEHPAKEPISKDLAISKPKKKRQVDAQEVAAAIKQTMARMTGPARVRRRHAKPDEDTSEAAAAKIAVTEFITTQELANLLEVPYQEIIRRCLELGMTVTINQRLDRDIIELLAAEFGVEVEFVQDEAVAEEPAVVDDGQLVKRPPVVTVMGHVDHGKTTLLDRLRRTRVAEAEVGGITQHIGAYSVNYQGETITFLDTPGHEAFTAMRARGVQVTDIVVLVVAADDRVMPQTLEAIDHARAARVPIIIAVNKIDKPTANPDAIYQQLADNGILVEKWGGKYQSAEISAKHGINLDGLLAEILVAAEVLDLKANPHAKARGVVVESRLDKGLGGVATVLVQSGTLKVGDPIVIGQCHGRVRSLFNERFEPVSEAGPATPVQVVGFTGIPQAGDRFAVVDSEKEARELSLRRQRQAREISYRQIAALSLDQVNRRMQEKTLQNLPLIIKGDVHGSVEVLCDSLMKLSSREVKVDIIHRGVGAISESDVLLAAASGAVIIGFHVHPNTQARELARREKVEIRVYRIIHEVIEDVRKSLEGMLAPEVEEHFQGTLEVRQVFKISRVGTVAGCQVLSGKITRKCRVHLLRDGAEVWRGELASLKRFKDDAREVTEGLECGVMLNGFNDVRVGDRIDAYEVVELARKLEDAM